MTINYFDILKSPLKRTNLVEASAGTGKTYTIAGLFLRLILEKGIPIDKILAVTYTEAATEELRNRIREKLKQGLMTLRNAGTECDDELLMGIAGKYRGNETAIWRLKDSLARFDEASICTIHGFCRRVLSENAFESNSLFNTELINDQSEIIKGIVFDFWRKKFYTAPGVLVQYASLNKITPLYFFRLTKNYSIDPYFRIIPRIEKPDLSKMEYQVLNTFNGLVNEWQSCRLDIEDIMLNYKGLSRTIYNKNVRNWIMQMDNYLNSSNPVMMFKKFERFTASSIKDSVKKGFNVPVHAFFDLCDDFRDIYNNMISILNDYLLYLEFEFFEFLKEESSRRKHSLNILSFDDLLVNMHKAIKHDKDSDLARAVRTRYRAALIDEFQDTDPVQYDIFKNIFGHEDCILFLIGDPKQSIYKFRGADIFAYLAALKNTDSRYSLGVNWRSTAGLVKAVNAVFKRKNPFVFKEIVFNEIKPAMDNKDELKVNDKRDIPFHIRVLDKALADMKGDMMSKGRAESIVSRAVAGEIYNLICLGRDGKARIEDNPLKPGHIAVLVRKRHQARKVQQELLRFNIPSVLYGSESIFASHEAIEMERIIAGITDPADEKRIRSALSTDIMGLSGNGIFKLGEDESGWERYLNRFYEYQDTWIKHGFFRMFMLLTIREGVRERLLSFTDGDRRMTNLMHLAELLHCAEIETKLHMEALVKWLADKRILPDDSDEYQIRLETDDDAVKLITIHRSKGLEFPIVFCPFMWEGSAIESGKPFTFHNPGDDYRLTLDLISDEENRGMAETEELAENIRLLYVALTRATHRSYLFWGRINKTETSALSYIFHNKGEDDFHEIAYWLKVGSKFKSYDAMIKDIRDLAAAYPSSMDIQSIPYYEYERFSQKALRAELTCKAFTGNINKEWRISSFSALTSGRMEYAERPDHDRIEGSISNETDIKEKREHNIFSFPRGPDSGSCIHEIFEELDFASITGNTAMKLINQKLLKYRISNEWQGILFNMINDVISTPILKGSDLILKKIAAQDRLNELEFYFPLGKITHEGLAEIFRRPELKINDFSLLLGSLGFEPHRGFVRGFIDLVFQYNERFYIVDWKSNYLGNDISDYTAEKIRSAMEKNYYILQYYIYAVALNRYLRKKKIGYEYNKHFGGIFYLFIRGVNPADTLSGIYYDLPPETAINALDHYLWGKINI